MNKIFELLALAVSGASLTLGLAPFNLMPLGILGTILLNHKLQQASPKQAMIYGSAFGFGFFGTAVSWVFVSINEFGNANYLLAGIITFGFIFLLSLFISAQSLALVKIFPNKSKIKSLLGFPITWVIFEWLRSFLFTGFPWAYLGYTQLDSPLQNYAPIIGVYGISWLCCTIASLILLAFSKEPKSKFYKDKIIIAIVLIFSGGYLLENIQWTTPEDKSHSISLIQGNISPTDKFLLQDPIATMQKSYEKLTLENLTSEYIIWPENSLPLPLPWSQNYINQLDKLAKENNVKLLIGMPKHIDGTRDFYNSIVAIGDAKGQYHKKKLVPFGDYLPFSDLLDPILKFFNIPMSSFIHGNNTQKNLTTPGSKLEPLICYEIAYPDLVRKMVKQNNSEAILNISEDGWFGKSLGPHQHLDIARMRALETGRYVIRSTTTGISAIITPAGEIIAESPQFKEFVLTSEFIDYSGNTPWMYLGSSWLIIIFVAILIGIRIRYGRMAGTAKTF